MKRLLMLAAAAIWSSSLLAQDSTRSLDPVVVTANKMEQKQSTTGKVITVITKEQIEKNNGKTVAQLLNEQASIAISGALNNEGTNQTIFLRGSASGRVLVLLDGIPVMDPSDINNNFDINLLSLGNIERIEICKGAQSTLYGSDAVAGVINIITLKTDIKKPFNINATALGGNYGTFKGNTQVYGKLDKLIYTIRYAKSYTDGFSSAYDSTGKNGYDKDGFNKDVADVNLLYHITPQLSVKGFIRSSHYKTDIDRSVFTDDKDYISTSNSFNTGGGFQFRNESVILTANYQYYDILRKQFDDSLDNPGSLLRNNYYGKAQFAEIYATIKLGNGFSFLQGADFRHHTIHQTNFLTYPESDFGPAGIISSQLDSVSSQASLYTSLLYSGLGERFNVELGARLNVHSQYGSNYTYTFNPSYAINSHLRIFGSIATGFKAPTLYQLYSDPINIGGNPSLKPERSQNYEMGIQQKHAVVTNRAVFFYRQIKNGIDYQNNFYPTPSKYFNFNKQEVRGLELESSAKIGKALTVSANYTYLNTTENTQSRKTFNDSTYKYGVRRPAHNLNINIGYTIMPDLYVSINGKYVSDRYDLGPYQTEDVKLSAYFILGAYGEYKVNKHVKIFANAQNLTDKKFFDLRGYNSIPFLINGGITLNL